MKLTALLPASLCLLLQSPPLTRLSLTPIVFTDNSPPYWEGRFSNGPTWLEHVNMNLTGIEIINNGHGGATTNNAQLSEYIVPGLKEQILTTYVNGTADDLYLIYIGYNDLNAIVNPDQYVIVDKNYTKEKVCQNVVDSVELLVNMYGANNFLVMSVPPFDQWPLTLKMLVKKPPTDLALGVLVTLLLVMTLKSISSGDSYHPSKEVHAAFGAWATEQIKSMYNIKLN
ncbi:hypothetical protein V8B55DRAFT_1461124 [Mucor lusitanicus]